MDKEEVIKERYASSFEMLMYSYFEIKFLPLNLRREIFFPFDANIKM